MNKNQNIAIIGAGICGIYLAWKLSEKGFNVTLFEKKNQVGKQACSGLFSQRILEFIPQAERLIQNQIEYAFLRFPKKTVKLRFSKKFFVMKHDELDRLALGFAEKAGADIVLNSKIDSLPQGFERIIGCGGALCPVRKILKLKNPWFRLGIQGFVLEKDYSNFVETWPTKNGFLWKIPRGLQTEYGIIEEVDKAKVIFDEFLKEKNIHLKQMNSALVPQGFIVPFNERITLCGDAAGLTKPWSGGGVIWGLIAANILLKNFPDFLKYTRELKKFFLPRIIFSKLGTRMVYLSGFNIPWALPKNVKVENDFLLSKL